MKILNIEENTRPVFILYEEPVVITHMAPVSKTNWGLCILGLLIAVGTLVFVLSW